MNPGERSSYRRLFGASARSFSSGDSSSRFSGSPSARSPGPQRRTGPSGGAFLPLTRTDSGHNAALNHELRLVRSNEKEQLQGLNDRFAVFIDKVRHLEQQNHSLQTELVSLRQKQNESRVNQVYKDQIQDLRDQVQTLNQDNSRLLVEVSNQEEELKCVCLRLEQEQALRAQAEVSLKSVARDVDEAAAIRLNLERSVESLSDEIRFMTRLHQEEIQELRSFMEAQQASVEVDPPKPDLTSALKEIRSQYESVAARNLQSAEDWYKSRFSSFSEQASRSNEAARASREELGEFRRQLQNKTIETESLRATNESLERQVTEMEEAHAAEVSAMQETISHLDTEIRNLKGKMAEHLREHQDLLNVKMALDIEIAAYRKLLEGEETHFNCGLSFGVPLSLLQSRPQGPESQGPDPRQDPDPRRDPDLRRDPDPRRDQGRSAKEAFEEEKEEEIFAQLSL